MSSKSESAFVNRADEEYIAAIPDSKLRAVMTESVMRHRRADSLSSGDPLPPLALTRLEDGTPVQLADLAGSRPLMLIFGSYT